MECDVAMTSVLCFWHSSVTSADDDDGGSVVC